MHKKMVLTEAVLFGFNLLFMCACAGGSFTQDIWNPGVNQLKRNERSYNTPEKESEHWTDGGSVQALTQGSAYKDNYIFDSEGPTFDVKHSKNITGLIGKPAVLNCRVKNIGNKTVSWIRHRDIHLLTVGRFSYTSDLRFTAVHSDGSEDWLMKVHYLTERDAGWYECQISTTPPISHMVFLKVVEPETIIGGGPDVYINTGSRLVLTCTVKYSPTPPAFIFWYHNDLLVSYDRSPGGVEVESVNKGQSHDHEQGHESTSRLLVHYAEQRHSGKYKCVPSNSKPKTVNVHVLAGEKQAAILHENNSVSSYTILPHSYLMMTSVSTLYFLSLSHVLHI